MPYRIPAWIIYLLSASTAALVCLLAGGAWSTWGVTLVQLSGSLAIVYGIRRFRPERVTFWWLLAAAQFTFTAAQGLWRFRHGGASYPIPFGDVTDVLYIGSFALFAVALAVGPLALDRRRGRIATIDSVVVALGLAFGTWSLVVQSRLADGQLSHREIVIFLAYEGLEILRLALLARLVLSGSLTVTGGLLGVGMLIEMLADLVYGVTMLAPTDPTTAFHNFAWVVGTVVIGAAGLRPAVPTTLSTPVVSRVRLGVFLLLVMIYPATMCVRVLASDLSLDQRFVSETVLPVMLTVTVAVLLLSRLTALSHAEHRRAGKMQAALFRENQLRAQLAHEATHDPLTGLANRVVLTDALAVALDDGSTPAALLLVDLDGFKEINDNYGHPAGDAVLRAVAARLSAATTEKTVVARLGGDEFALLVRGTDAVRLADRVVRNLAEPYPVDDVELAVSCSVGVLTLDPQAAPADAFRDADLALYAAKNDGRNRVVVFHPELRAAWARQSMISNGLRAALHDGRLALHYQPIVDLRSGGITALESLMRWTPVGGPSIPPAEFIPVAERTGLINELGRWALRTACADVRPWYFGHGISVTVNVSARQLDDPTFGDDVLAALTDHDLPGAALTLELTESMLVDVGGGRQETVMRTLRRLREHGVRIAIDDFGTGYSSLAYLHELPVDILKLDRRLTLGGTPDAQQSAITRAVIDLGNGLDLQTVAEGIETADQADLLRHLGSPRAQGYFFGRPMPADAVPAVLDNAASSARA